MKNKDLENVYIEGLTGPHVKEILDFFENNGYDAASVYGVDNNKENNFTYRYYGVYKGHFNWLPLEQLETASIYTLEEAKAKIKLTYPRVMLVSDFNNFVKRVVIAKKDDVYISWTDATTLEEAETVVDTIYWKNAKEIPIKIDISIDDLLKKYDIDSKLYNII